MGRTHRLRKPNGWLAFDKRGLQPSDAVDTTQRRDQPLDARPVLPIRKRGRPRKNAAAAQPAANTHEGGLDGLPQTREDELVEEEEDIDNEDDDGDLRKDR